MHALERNAIANFNISGDESMRLYVVSSMRSEKVAAFERYALEKNCELRISTDGASRFSVAGDTAAAVAIFDDGDENTLEWVAKVRENTRYLSVPLVAVSRAERDARARLLAAGATAVCDIQASNEAIFSELMAHCNIEPVLEEIRTKLVGPFTSATILAIKEMAGIDVEVRSVYQKVHHKMFGDISAVIGLVARTEGAMVLSFPDASASNFVKRVLSGLDDHPSDDMMRDCIGEIANVIVGQARGIIAGSDYEFVMATPTIVSGTGHEIRHKPGTPCLVIAFSSKLGEFALQLCLGR
jgi:chemotaxis protein CheX